MSFNGSLLKLGGTEFPLSYIYKESYSCTPHMVQDLDSTRDANGNLVRNTLSHQVTSITFETKPQWNTDHATMMTLIRSAYTVEAEKKLQITYYSPDTDSYETGYFYMPDVAFPILRVDTENNRILFASVTLEFIEY